MIALGSLAPGVSACGREHRRRRADRSVGGRPGSRVGGGAAAATRDRERGENRQAEHLGAKASSHQLANRKWSIAKRRSGWSRVQALGWAAAISTTARIARAPGAGATMQASSR